MNIRGNKREPLLIRKLDINMNGSKCLLHKINKNKFRTITKVSKQSTFTFIFRN